MPVKQVYLLLVFGPLIAAGTSAQGLVNDYQQFMAAYNEKNYSRCVIAGEPLVKASNHPGIQYKLAECLCQNGQTDQSLEILQLLAKRGLAYKPAEHAGFAPLYNNQRFKELAAIFRENSFVIENSDTSFVIDDSLLIPEGIAYDLLRNTFYISSLAKQKIIKCSTNTGCKDFAMGSEHGFWLGLGMKVSQDSKSIWLCSASERDTIDGHAGIFQFEIPSGKLLKKYTVDNQNGPHLFNDIVFTASGDIYFTDSRAGKVWQLDAGADTLKEISNGYIYPNGIAMDEARKVLFLADFTGLHMIDLETGKQSRISDQGITYLNGIDGLYYYKGTLIAIQDSGNQDDRIVQFSYDVKKKTITGVKVLQSFRADFITPTTGSIVNDEFHYIANAQLRSLQPDGSITNPEKLVRPVILKLKLD